MPELPEVETIRTGLENKIIGKSIADIVIDNKKSFQGEPNNVIGQQVIGVERRAKVLRIKLKNNFSLLFHLKMTGQLIFIDLSEKRVAGGHPSHDWHDKLPNKHTRITFLFNDESKLFFNDLRKFGWCKVMNENEINNVFNEYGPEPFSKEFNADYLYSIAQGLASRNIKQFLMDQTIVAGIGNIYNDEALFLSRLMPTTKAKNLTRGDWENVIANVKQVLTLGIKYGGTTDSDYVDAEGKKGGMQNYLNVYHRTGEKCPGNCGGIVEKMKIGGRGTYYCPSCQKEKK